MALKELSPTDWEILTKLNEANRDDDFGENYTKFVKAVREKRENGYDVSNFERYVKEEEILHNDHD